MTVKGKNWDCTVAKKINLLYPMEKNAFCLLVYALLPLQTTLNTHAFHTTFSWTGIFSNLFCRIEIVLVSDLQKYVIKRLSHNPLSQWFWICPLIFLKLLIVTCHLFHRQWQYLNVLRLQTTQNIYSSFQRGSDLSQHEDKSILRGRCCHQHDFLLR